LIDIIETKICVESLYVNLHDTSCGAVATFEGRVRDHNNGKKIESLSYECYREMALKVMSDIREEALQKWTVNNIVTVHRVGNIPIGDCAVWIGVSSSHRKEAFKSCEYMIDEIKHRVPIWKKERYLDGTVEWVECHHESALI